MYKRTVGTSHSLIQDIEILKKDKKLFRVLFTGCFYQRYPKLINKINFYKIAIYILKVQSWSLPSEKEKWSFVIVIQTRFFLPQQNVNP